MPSLLVLSRRFALAGMVGVVGYVLVDVVLQMLPPHYDVIRDAESNLAVGPFGWAMNLNFLGRSATTACALVAVAATGTRTTTRDVGSVLLALGGVSSALLAFLPTDVADITGAVRPTAAGTAHLWVAGVGFVAALAGILVLTAWVRSRPALRSGHAATSVLAAAAAGGLLVLGASQVAAPEILGLAERACLAAMLGWTFVVCAVIRRQPPVAGAGSQAGNEDSGVQSRPRGW